MTKTPRTPRGPRWNARTLIHFVQLEYEDEPRQQREIRLVSASARPGDPVRVKLSGVEVEGRITDVRYVRIGQRLF